ncbi:MAG TPA: Hsp20/alpha crystallin family protein [Burkholderiaceae bacterium]|nr:Hsp20/alpha crystallin family protein [Burkholderiaceae bacterium]
MRDDPTARMWLQALDLLEQAEGLHRQFFRPSGSARTAAVWEPPVDVIEDAHEIVIVVAMPGVAADRMQVTQEGDALVVRGVRPFPLTGSHHAVRQLEIPHGVFERRIALPAGRLELGAPQVVDGCLVLVIRKLGPGR